MMCGIALALATGASSVRAQPRVEPSAVSASLEEVAAPGDPRLARLTSRAEDLAGEDPRARRAAYDALSRLSEDDLPAVRARIATLARVRPPENWVAEILPRFHRRALVEGEAPDLARGALAELDQAHASPREREHVALLAETLFLWRGLQRLGTLEAARAAYPLIGLDDGAWLPEARGWVRREGPRVITASLTARTHQDPAVRAWSRWAVEQLGAEDPGRTVHRVAPEQLPDLLLAYAQLRMQSAMRVIVSYIASDRRSVRRAARDAMALYAGNAIWTLRTAYRNHTGEAAPLEWGWRRLSDALYAHLDAARRAPVQAALEAGLTARGAGDRSTMEARFGEVLAGAVELEDPTPVAEGYAELAAQRRSEGRVEEARRALRRALRLAPQHPAATEWRAGLALVTAEELGARGYFDRPLYEEALASAATRPDAQAALARARPPALTTPEARGRSSLLSAGVLALLGLLLTLLGRTRARRAGVEVTPVPEGGAATFDEAEGTWVDQTLPG